MTTDRPPYTKQNRATCYRQVYKEKSAASRELIFAFYALDV